MKGMATATKVERCAFFVGEFGEEYRRKFGFGIGRRLVVVRELLGYDGRDRCVRFQVTVQPEGSEEEIRFMLEPLFFAPEDHVNDQMDRVADDLEVDADVVRRRFAQAGLLRGKR